MIFFKKTGKNVGFVDEMCGETKLTFNLTNLFLNSLQKIVEIGKICKLYINGLA